MADQVDSSFVAGIARHTLLTATARSAGDERTALAGFGPLIDHWHRYGAWTQLWIAARALIETLSRFGRHRDVALLVGALGASSRASRRPGPTRPGSRRWSGPPGMRLARSSTRARRGGRDGRRGGRWRSRGGVTRGAGRQRERVTARSCVTARALLHRGA